MTNFSFEVQNLQLESVLKSYYWIDKSTESRWLSSLSETKNSQFDGL